MTRIDCARYQKNSSTWIIIFTFLCSGSIVSLSISTAEDDVYSIVGVLGIILGAFGIFAAWLLKKYYASYEAAFQKFDTLKTIAQWKVSHEDWLKYEHIEKKVRNKGLIAYLVWSPVLVIALAIMIYLNVDELSFDSSLLIYGVAGYVFVIGILYFQSRHQIKKTSHVGDHLITLKPTGVQIDDAITYWGKLAEEKHDSLTESAQALILIKGDEDRQVNEMKIIEEGGLHYLFINYSHDENNNRDLYLPIPNNTIDYVSKALNGSETSSEEASTIEMPNAEAPAIENKKYNSQKILKWMMGLVAIGSAGIWLLNDGMPAYNQWQAESKLEEGNSFFNEGKYNEAAERYKASIDDYDQMPEPYLNLSSIFLFNGQLDSANYYCDLALAVNPNYEWALLNKGKIFYSQKNYNDIQAFRKYEVAAPSSHEHDLMMGDELFNVQKYDSALFYYQRAYNENKKSPELCFLIGTILSERQNWNEAITYFNESIQIDSTFAKAHLSLADVYSILDNKELAQEHLTIGNRLKSEGQ
jgi:Tfp pilus assembly protein PilF